MVGVFMDDGLLNSGKENGAAERMKKVKRMGLLQVRSYKI
jgi:hypothetical protein